jgi:hypothetical protein
MYWLFGSKSKLSTNNKLLAYKKILKTNLDLWNTTLGYGFHFQHRNSRTFPIESHRFSEHLIVPGIEPGTYGSVVRHSDHYTTEAVLERNNSNCKR